MPSMVKQGFILLILHIFVDPTVLYSALRFKLGVGALYSFTLHNDSTKTPHTQVGLVSTILVTACKH